MTLSRSERAELVRDLNVLADEFEAPGRAWIVGRIRAAAREISELARRPAAVGEREAEGDGPSCRRCGAPLSYAGRGRPTLDCERHRGGRGAGRKIGEKAI